MNPLQCLQNVLDNFLLSENIPVFWQKRVSDDKFDEYFVYALNGDDTIVSGDNKIISKNIGITLRYYYRDSILLNSESRKIVQNRIFNVIDTLRENGFFVPDGAFDAGVDDSTGYAVTVFELTYYERK